MVRAVITYTERPVTLEEKAVAEVLTTVVAAAQKSDLALLESAFADDAKIAAIFEDTMLSKKEFFHKMASIVSKSWRLAYRDVVIRILNSNEAIVYCTGTITFEHALAPRSFGRSFALKKRKEKWLITEAQ